MMDKIIAVAKQSGAEVSYFPVMLRSRLTH